MPNLTSHNSQPIGLARQLFLPNPVQAFLYVLSSLIILAAGNINAIWNYLNHDPIGQKKAANLLINNPSNSSFLNNFTQNRISQIFFWVIVGSVLYAVIWFIKNVFTNLHNDIIADEFVHPKFYSRAKYWKSVLSRKLWFGAISCLLVGFLYASIKIIPSLFSIFSWAIYNFQLSSLIDLSLVVLVLALLMHVLVVLTRLTANSWRFIHADL